MIIRIVRKAIVAMLAIVLFLFAYNYVVTEMAKDNFKPMLWLFLVLIALIVYRVIRTVLKRIKRLR